MFELSLIRDLGDLAYSRSRLFEFILNVRVYFERAQSEKTMTDSKFDMM